MRWLRSFARRFTEQDNSQYEQGTRNIKERIGQADAFKAMAKKSGVSVKELWRIAKTKL
jgi:hypothetical protein